jgi:uncharacterized NAD-dependent epimerase/dehydratase family protein
MGKSIDKAIVYCEGNFGKMDGKTANGLVRHSKKHEIIGVIDSTRAGQDTGNILDGNPNGIMIYKDIKACFARNGKKDIKTFIYGMAPMSGLFSKADEQIMFHAMEENLNIVNGLHDFLTDKAHFAKKAKDCGVELCDIRKPKGIGELGVFTGNISKVKCPKIAILGTDGAVGKRTSSTILTKALCEKGLNAVMVATGQTALIQGAKYGIALDAIPEQFISGAMEKAVCQAWDHEKPDIIIIEGQGALSHPAYLSSCFIIRGSQPDAIIVQHPPKREFLGDYPKIKMPTLESEINLLESFSGKPVLGIALNHENMTTSEIDETITEYQDQFDLPVTDVLTYNCDCLIEKILSEFPALKNQIQKQLN